MTANVGLQEQTKCDLFVSCILHDASCWILQLLQLVDIHSRRSTQHGVAVIETSIDQWPSDCLSSVFRNALSDMTQCWKFDDLQMLSTCISILFFEWQFVIEYYPKTVDTSGWFDADTAKVDSACRTFESLSCAGADNNCFGLVRVPGQTVDVKPVLFGPEALWKRRSCFHVIKCDV